jgi:4-hydroxy-2-oxoglutarate aldolase
MTTEALEAHYRRVADASPVPVLLYNMPKYTHLVLDPAMVHRLAAHGNVVGMKDSGGEMERLGQYLQAQGEGFTVLTGNGQTFRDALRRGARGGILAVALFAAELAMTVFHDPEGEAAADAQGHLSTLGKDIVGALGPAGVKAAMDQAGLTGGPVRPPLLAISAAQRDRVAALMQAAGVAVAA